MKLGSRSIQVQHRPRSSSSISLTLTSGRFVWVYGPVTGNTSDIELSRQSGIGKRLLRHESILADKAYIGPDLPFLTPKKGTTLEPYAIRINKELSRVRVLVEDVLGRTKHFNILRSDFRSDRDLHANIFFIICHIVNYEIRNHPMRAS